MKSKKKLMIALLSLCVVVVATIVTVVAVMAATKTKFKGNVVVKYTATDVAGTVSANYKLKGTGEGVAFAGGTDGVLTIDAELQNDVEVGTLAPASNITLTKDNRFVLFTFNFTNSGSRDYTATISYTDDKADPNAEDANIIIEYSTDNTTFKASSDAQAPKSITVESGDEDAVYSFYIKVSIDKIAKDAEFSGSFSWDLQAV